MENSLVAPYIDEISACIHEKQTEQTFTARLKEQIVSSKFLTTTEKLKEMQGVSRYANRRTKALNDRINVAIKSN